MSCHCSNCNEWIAKVEKLRETLKGLPRWAYVEDEYWDSIQQVLADTEEK